MKTIIHLIPSMGYGGAEIMLAKLLSKGRSQNQRHVVISLLPTREMVNTSCHDLIIQLNIKRRPIWSIKKMIQVVREHKRASIVGWLYIGCLFSFFLTLVSPHNAAFFIHHSLTDLSVERKQTRILVHILSILSRSKNIASLIFVSQLSYIQHRSIGYSDKKSIVIYNGIDRSRFASNEKLRVPTDERIVVGSFGRYHPVKDHGLLFSLIREIKRQGVAVELHLAGVGVDKCNVVLTDLFNLYELEDCVVLHGVVDEIENIYDLLDVYVLSSKAESFPNVILEAMCYGILIVSTDVGDVKATLEEDYIPLEHDDLSSTARKIIDQYRIGKIERYKKYQDILIEHFDDSKQTRKLLEALQNV